MDSAIKTYSYTLEQITGQPEGKNFRGPIRELNWEESGTMLVFDRHVRGRKIELVYIGLKKSEPRDTVEGREIDYVDFLDAETFESFNRLWKLNALLYIPGMD